MRVLLAVGVAGRWRPGIGDPTVLGWVTVAAYALAAYSCFRAARREPVPAQPGRARPARLWLALTLLLLALGINKQLDLQTWVTEVGRDTLRAMGLYGQRRNYQLAFIAAVTLGCTGLLVALHHVARPVSGPRFSALAGACFLVAFVLIRASSFHNVDILLAATLGRLKWNWILELGGITVIGLAAFCGTNGFRRSQSAAFGRVESPR